MKFEELHPDMIEEDGSIFCIGWYLGWNVNEEHATLDGEFNADDLEAIADYMRRKRQR